MADDHHHHDADAVGFGVLTVSTTRTLETDPSGDTLAAAIEDGGHSVAARDLVGDDERTIRRRVEALLDHGAVEAVVTTGGTGVTPDDVTVEAVRPLFDRELPGFGERFRARSVEQVGPHAMVTRATAGIADRVPVFCLPGSEQAAAFGASELIVPIVGHVVGLASGGRTGHDHDHDHDERGDHHGEHGHDHDGGDRRDGEEGGHDDHDHGDHHAHGGGAGGT
jgi:molybdenum cofactor biosynthesis protein B